MNLLMRALFACCLLVVVVGCGPGSTPVEQEDTRTPPSELIKIDLETTAENGRLGSEMMSIQQNLDKLAEEDPAKAEELSKDLKELEGLSGNAAKRKAQSMIDKL